MTYIEISDINLSDKPRFAQLRCDDSTLNNIYDHVYLHKFSVTGQSFPIFIPSLRSPAQTPLLHIPPATNIVVPPESDFYLDWAISIFDKTTSTNCSMPVRWIPQKTIAARPSVSHGVSRQETITNEYFWAFNSIHVIHVIQDTIKKILLRLDLPSSTVRIVKTSDAYQILCSSQNVCIFFNYELRQCFNFYYTTSTLHEHGVATPDFQEVIVNHDVSMEFGGIDYYVAQTLSLTTRMFAFTDIIFSTNTLPIEPIRICNNLELSTQFTQPIVFSYGLSVPDMDSIADKIYFTATSTTRPGYLKDVPIKIFDINIYFKTFDNYRLPITLNKGDSVTTLFEFV